MKMMSVLHKKICWIITDGSAGMENQALGLGEALNYVPILKRVTLRQPWLFLAPYFRGFKEFCTLQKAELSEPFPPLVIACGRRSILPALWIKEKSKNISKVIYLQNPKISPRHFDAVICPYHDRISGANVFRMTGAPHRITADHLKQGYDTFSSLFKSYPTPRYGVLLGGPNKAYILNQKVAHTLIKHLKDLQKQDCASLLISPSRRTPDEVVSLFKEEFSHTPNVYIWDKMDKNPYFGILACSDALLLTADSVSMISEVCATEKPVYILPLPGGNQKFIRFHEQLIRFKRAEYFMGKVTLTPATPFNETNFIAEKIKEFLSLEPS